MEGAETYSPAWWTVTHGHVHATSGTQSSCSHLCRNPWREGGCGRDDRVCRKRQWEDAREQGGEEEAVVKVYTWKSPGAAALWSLLVSFIFRVEMWLSGGYSHPLQLPKSLSVGFPGTEAAVQLHPANTGISVYSHKPTTHVFCSDLLVTRHTKSTYKACPIHKKITPVSTGETGIFGLHLPQPLRKLLQFRTWLSDTLRLSILLLTSFIFHQITGRFFPPTLFPDKLPLALQSLTGNRPLIQPHTSFSLFLSSPDFNILSQIYFAV